MRGYELQGARQLTINTVEALRALGFTHPVGGRPLPGAIPPRIDEVLPLVLEKMTANHFARHQPAGEGQIRRVRTVVEHENTNRAPWPLQPLFDNVASGMETG